MQTTTATIEVRTFLGILWCYMVLEACFIPFVLRYQSRMFGIILESVDPFLVFNIRWKQYNIDPKWFDAIFQDKHLIGILSDYKSNVNQVSCRELNELFGIYTDITAELVQIIFEYYYALDVSVLNDQVHTLAYQTANVK